MSATKKNHAYIKTETQGQLLVPIQELQPEIKEAEFFESGNPRMSSLDMARHILVPEYGFTEYTKNKMFIKYISDTFYITAQCFEASMVVALFNRKTMQTDDKLSVDSGNRVGDIIGFSEKGKILNKIVQWTKQFGDQDPVVETDLVEDSDLNMMSTNAETEAVIKLIMQVMKAKGYKGKRTNQSAMFEIEFQGPGPRITIDGWHGNGNYGRSKMLFSVYVDSKPAIDMSVKSDDLDDSKSGEYWASEAKKQAYLKGLEQVRKMFQSGSVFTNKSAQPVNEVKEDKFSPEVVKALKAKNLRGVHNIGVAHPGIIVVLSPDLPVKEISGVLTNVEMALKEIGGLKYFSRKVVAGLHGGSPFQIQIQAE